MYRQMSVTQNMEIDGRTASDSPDRWPSEPEGPPWGCPLCSAHCSRGFGGVGIQTVEDVDFEKTREKIAVNRTLHKDPKNRTTKTPDDRWDPSVRSVCLGRVGALGEEEFWGL